MLKAILYLVLTAFGITATFIDPFAGVLTCIAAYLANPSALELPDGAFRYQLWTTLALLASFAIHGPWRGPQQEKGLEVWVMRLLWAFVGFAALTATWALVSSTIALETVYEVVKTVLLISIIVRLVRSERQMSLLVTVLVIGAWHAALMHVFGVRWGYVRSGIGREFGVLSDSQTGVMVMFVPLLVLLAMFGSRTQRLLSWCALPFVMDSIIVTYERTGLVAVALEVVFLLFYLPRRITFRLMPALAAAGVLFVFRLTPQDYWEKMATITAPTEEASANSRFVVNKASLQMFLDYPMGVGYRNYPYVSPKYLPDDALTTEGDQRLRSAHNSYFTILCETGVIGFALWSAALAVGVVLFRRLRKKESAAGSTLAMYGMAFEVGLYGWAAAGWTQAYHEVDPAYWFAGFSVILTRLARENTLESSSTDAAVVFQTA